MMTVLESLRDALATLPGIHTCKIGLEANLTAEDYPIIRIVPGRAQPASLLSRRKIEVTIYLGLAIHPFDDNPDAQGRVRLEKLHAALFDLEALAVAKLEENGGICRDSILDEDRIEAYKLVAVRAEVEG